MTFDHPPVFMAAARSLAGVLLAATLLTACGSAVPAPADQSAGAPGVSAVSLSDAGAARSAPAGSAAPGSAAPSVDPVKPALTVTGPGGEVITLDKEPERIVCLTGLCDDVLVELGLQPVGTSTPDLLALPQFLGADSSSVSTITGSFGSEDVESIAALRPDLVVGLAGAHDQMRSAVEQFAPLWLLDVTSYQDSVDYLRAFAALTDRPEQGVAAETAFNASLSAARQASAEQGLSDTTALAMYSSGAGMGVNTEDDLLGGLLGEVFSYPWPNKGGGWDTAQAYSVEEILAVNPEIIFVQSFTASQDAPKASQELAQNPVWKQISAVQAGKVVEVDTALWTAGRGPRALSLVLDEAVAATS